MATELKKHSRRILIFCITAILCFGCSEEDLKNILNSDKTVDGLKEALKVGVEKSVDILSARDGYLSDNDIKIRLPSEAQTTFNVIRTISGNPALDIILNSLDINVNFEETLITLFNRAAEDAAPKAVGIFTSTITNMTISDGKNILFGAKNAATQYLEDKTYINLQAAFEPSITASLSSDNVKVAGYTPVQAWDFFSEQNNLLASTIQEYANTFPYSLAINALPDETKEMIFSIKNVETDLSNYVTGKALDGLFVKVAEQEYKIRTNVEDRITPLLKEVFGQLDNHE